MTHTVFTADASITVDTTTTTIPAVFGDKLSAPVQVMCKFTIDNQVRKVYVNDADITSNVTGDLSDWQVTKQVVFTVPRGQTAVLALIGRDFAFPTPGYERHNCAGLVLACQSVDDSNWGSLVSGISQGWKATDASALQPGWFRNAYNDAAWHPAVGAAHRGCSGCTSSFGTLPKSIWANVSGAPSSSCLTDQDAAFRIAIHVDDQVLPTMTHTV